MFKNLVTPCLFSLLWSGLLAAQPGMAAAQDQDAYVDALANGWQDYSFSCTRSFTNATPVHGGSDSIAVTITAAYGALSLHHSAFPLDAYSSLTLWANGGATGGQRLQVWAESNATQGAHVNLPTLAANTWTQISVSLDSVKVPGQTTLDRFYIQDLLGRAQPIFYVDDIKLLATPPPAVVSVAVDASAPIRTVDDRIFGLNTAVWDNVFNGAANRTLLQAADFRFLRFPGGSRSDDYHWATNRSDGNNYNWFVTFDQFISMSATSTGAQPIVTVNYGSGTPAEAAAWVRYSNVSPHQYGVKYWEVGNEIYGNWENDTNTTTGSRAHDPVTYATRAAAYITQMKAVDPTIKIGVVVVPSEDSYANYSDLSTINPRTGATHKGWTPVMLAKLKSLGVTPDFLIHHEYPQDLGGENDAGVLQAAARWPGVAANLRQQLNDYLGATLAPGVELICTENNSTGSTPTKQTTSLVNALYAADSLGQVMKTEFNGLVWWALRNTPTATTAASMSLYGWRTVGDLGIMTGTTDIYPVYYAFKLLRNFARGGDQVLQATSNYNLLSTYATRRADGSLSILVINKSPTATQQAQFSVASFTPDATAATYSYGMPQDNAAQAGTGSTDIATGTLPVAPTFTATFAPYSLTVISLTPAPVIPPDPTVTDDFSTTPDPVRWVNDLGFQQSGYAQAGYDSGQGALRATLWPADAGKVRVTGWRTLPGSSADIPYSSIPAGSNLRATFAIFAEGQATTDAAEIPNLRLKVGNRFAVAAYLDLVHWSNDSPGTSYLGDDLRPTTNPLAPSTYTIDYVVPRVPATDASATSEAISRSFEAYALDPQANGSLALAESTIALVPALATPSAQPASLLASYSAGSAEFSQVFGASRALKLSSNFDSIVSSQALDNAFAIDVTQGLILSGQGLPANDSATSDLIGVASADFLAGAPEDGATKPRVEAGKVYQVRFHATSTQASSLQPLIRFRARSARYAWNYRLEVGSAHATGAASNAIAQQFLPGVGCLNPDQKVSGEPGGWYALIFHTPLDPALRPEFPAGATIAERMPRLSAEPGPGVAQLSARDISPGLDIIDTPSVGPDATIEVGHVAVDQIDIQAFEAP